MEIEKYSRRASDGAADEVMQAGRQLGDKCQAVRVERASAGNEKKRKEKGKEIMGLTGFFLPGCSLQRRRGPCCRRYSGWLRTLSWRREEPPLMGDASKGKKRCCCRGRGGGGKGSCGKKLNKGERAVVEEVAEVDGLGLG